MNRLKITVTEESGGKLTSLEIMKPCLTHIALHVDDIDACIDFYSRYCGMKVLHHREHGSKQVIWMSELGKETEFILVFISGAKKLSHDDSDFSHLGFAVADKETVDKIADQAAGEGCLLWPPQDNPYPVGYYCGVLDPQGNAVEFSYGQPLGPGAR